MSAALVRCAFVAIKLKIDGVPVLLAQRDPRWSDVNLVGGHENAKDRGKPEATGRRETLEELSALRRGSAFHLESLGGPVSLGPKWSKSAKRKTIYQLNFFLLLFEKEPVELVDVLRRGRNSVLVPLSHSADPTQERSEVMQVLEDVLPGGFASLPYSWEADLGTLLRQHGIDVSVAHQNRLRLA